jgi:diguanylate cyclase (GGDEF)-like protein
MRKDDLKSLVTQMYENLLEKIDLEENADKKQVINYLKDSIDIFSDISEHRLESIEKAKLAFTDEYKELTHKTLKAYSTTNSKFKELAQFHGETIEECHDDVVDIPVVAEKFTTIQSKMTDEILQANQIINQLTKQVKTLEKTSNVDSLTKVYNRRALTSYLNDICAKDGIPYELHLLILDIDDFKIINDQYGHIAGDKILIFISNILRKTLRDGDRVFRYGGEEFIIILNRTNDKHCQNITQRLLELIRSNKLIYKGNSLFVTMSIGTTKYKSGDTPDELISRADKALYKAKANGKNQICVEH